MFRNSQKTLQKLLDHTNIGYYKYRFRDGVLIDANKGFIDILDLKMSIKKIKGKSLSELLTYIEEEDNVREWLNRRSESRVQRKGPSSGDGPMRGSLALLLRPQARV